MLQNHSRPPGPYNRGQRSLVSYDKRPLVDQIVDRIVDKEPQSDLKEVEHYFDKFNPDVEEHFAERDRKTLFSSEMKPGLSPSIEVIMQSTPEGNFWSQHEDTVINQISFERLP